RMKDELGTDFGVPGEKVSVIPFGINNVYPSSAITSSDAKERLGIKAAEKTALFFGQIAPYKGLEYLISAIARYVAGGEDVRLIIAGRVKPGCAAYWEKIQADITLAGLRDRIIEHVRN